MGDPFRKVRPGEDVSFDAVAHNATMDVARAHRLGSLDQGAGREGQRRDAAIVRVKNETGSALSRGQVVGLGAPIFSPSDSIDAFLREVTFRGVVPTASHAAKFAILLEPVADGRVGRAFVAGVCPARVDVSDLGHARAAAADGETAALASAASGPAQILWAEGGTGEQWALILFGTSCG